MGVTYTHPQGTPDNGANRTVTNGGNRPYIQVGSTYKPGDTYTTGLYVVGGSYDSWSYDGATVTISGDGYVAMRGGNSGTAGSQTAYWYATWGSGSWTGGMGGYVAWLYSAPGAPYFTAVNRSSDGTSLYVAVAGGSGRVTYHNVYIDGYGWSGNGTTFSTNAHQSYNVYGRAGNEDNVSGTANWGVSHGIPNAPGKPSVSANGSVQGRIDVSWAAPSYVGAGIAEYHVYRDGAFLVSTTSTSYADTGRTVGTSYSYAVYARNSTGWSPVSTTSDSITATGVPNAPTALSVTASTNTFGKVSLSWTAPSIATGGVVDYFMYADGVLKGSSTTTSGIITGLNERQTYSFTVRARNQFAINNNTLGAESSGISRKSPAPPSAPLSLQSTAPFVPAGTINLTWDPPADDGDESAGITGYNIYLAGQTEPFDTIDGTDTEYTAESLVPATSYTFTVRARNAIADTVGTFSVDSNTTTAQAQGEPDAPTGLTVTADPIVAGKLIVSWTPPVGYITGFRVYNATTNAEIANVVTPRLEVEGLSQNQSYAYKVRARNPVTDSLGSDGGPFSATVSGTPSGTSTQTVPSVSVANQTNITLTGASGTGTFPLVSTTATTMTYAKTASNIASASVPLTAGSTTNETNLLVNGTYTIDIPTTKTVRYARSGVTIASGTGTPSGTMTNDTNIKFTGNEGTGTFAVSGTDPLTNKVSYLKTAPDITSVAATGLISNESNEIYNGQYTLTGVTETTMTFDKTADDISQTLAYGSVFNKTNNDIFNGTYDVIETPDYQTFTYNTGDQTYAENLITNPSMETVQTGSTTLRTNLATNPSFETNVTGWTTSSSTLARNNAFSQYGTHSGLVTPATSSGGVTTSVTTTSGLSYTVSMWVYATSATSIQMTVDSPATTGATTAISADVWTRVSLTFTANTTTTAVGIKTYGSSQPFYIDGMLVEQTSELRPYFDGATTDALGWDYGWVGTANASTSTAKALSVGGLPVTVGYTSTASDIASASAYAHSGTRSSYATNGASPFGAGTDNSTKTVAMQPDGKTLLGGSFTTWNGTTVNRIVRLNSDGTRDTAFTTNTGTAASSEVQAIAVQSDGKILVCGVFSTWNGTTVTGTVRLNSDGTRDTAFTTNIGSAGFLPSAVAVQSDGKILIGGSFTTWNGSAAKYIVRLNSDGTRDTAFTTNTGTGPNSDVIDIAVQPDGKILLVGFFTTWNGTTVNRVVRLNADGTRDTAFTTNTGTGANQYVQSVVLQLDGKILLCGGFTSWSGATATYVVRLNSDGTKDTGFSSNTASAANTDVLGMAVQPDGKIILSGFFTTWNGTTVNRIVRLNSDGTRDTSFATGTAANNYVESVLVQSDGKILLGGAFTTWNGKTHNRVALLNSSGIVLSLNDLKYTATTVADTVYTVSAWVRPTVDSNVSIYVGVDAGVSTVLPADVWSRVSRTFTATSTSTVLAISSTTLSDGVYVDDAMLQESSTLQTYFDGDTDATATTWPVVYSWAGTPHASISSREVGETLPVIGSDILLPYGDASRGESQASLQIRYRSGWLG